MKTTQFKCLVTTFLLVAAMVMPSTAQAQTITPVQPGGEGTASIPYLISTAEELYWFAGLVNGDASVCINGISQNRNAWAVLESDITVNSGVLKADGTLADDVSSFAQWTPIGNSSYRYTGNFDGQGHTISGLYFNNNTGSSNVGLFGYIDKSYDANASCTIQNVGIVDSYFNGYSCVGSVCGCSYFGTISNCYNTGTVIATDYHSGGICGLSNYSSIEKCYNTGSVEGYTIVGGVAGQCMYGSITNCYNTGSVKGVGTASAGVGGVCETAVSSEVTNCYNIGTLSGQTVGNVINSSCKTLTNSYYLADGETDEREGTTAMSADQFANGEVAYLLNGSVSDGSQKWYQTIGTDGAPVLDNTRGTVYYATLLCGGEKNVGNTYANTQEVSIEHDYNENGFCTICGAYQPATLTTDKYDINGDNTKDEVYEIGNAGQLYWFAALVNGTLIDGTAQNLSANAVLVNDITVNTDLLNSLDENGEPRENLTVQSWTPIGYYINSSDYVYYEGTFDGNGYSISGLYVKYTNQGEASFIGDIEEGCVKNIAILDSYFEGSSLIGGIVGYLNNGIINNCLFSGTVKSQDKVGGICGAIQGDRTISDCFSNAKILVDKADNYCGGICGVGWNSLIKLRNCVYNNSLYTGEAIKWRSSAGTVEHITGMETAEIASGKATYWLNRYKFGDGIGWHQNIDNGQTEDAYPVLDNTHGVVYTSQPCPSSGIFSNTKPSSSEGHNWGENNVCTKCGKTKDVLDLVEGFQEPSQVGGVYQISTAGELYWFTALVNGNGLLTDGTPSNNSANAVLTSDITVNSNVLDESGNLAVTSDTRLDWIPIGNSDRPYTGTFDGQGYTISGLYFNDSSKDYVGLFGYIYGKIQNTGVIDSYFEGDQAVGGLCGNLMRGEIKDCFSKSFVKGRVEVGGVCGDVSGSKVENAYQAGIVCGSSETETTVNGIFGGIYYNSTSGNSQCSNCYYDTTLCPNMNACGSTSSATNVEGKTTSQFASGEVAYLLNNSKSDGAWGQTIGTDPYPVLDGDKVYYGYADCDESKDQTYSNTELADTRPKHNYVNGFCTKCGEYQPATLTTDKYDINGDNTKDEVYEIGNAGQLYWFAALVNGTLIDGTAQNLSANAVLVNDITVNTGVLKADGTLASDTSGFKAWTPIVGNSYPNNYAGTFDGQNHTVSGLYFNDSSANKIGLFGHLGSSGKISNVGVVDSYFCGNQFVGGVCGAKYGAMENCYSASTVSGTESVGGVCGNNFNGKLLNCYNTGAVIGTGWYIGGVCGIVNNGGTIQNCYSTGTVGGSSSSSVVGGVCGMNNRSGTISNCYFDSEKCDKDAIGTNNGTVTNVEGKTTEQFKSGEVCYLLNGSVSDGSQKWYQTIGTDGAPVLDNTRGTVYYATLLCGGEKNVGNTYANTQEVSIEHDYNENGFCTVCGEYEAAELKDGVYQIKNAGQLCWFAALVNGDNTHADFDAQNTSASAVLTNDIDLENREWKPITAFAGSFDGQGHTVSNFKITSTTNNSGFFGSANGTIMNFTLKGEITLSADGAEIGSIVGNTDGATIRNVVSYVNISNTAVELKHVGGVVGSIQTTETVVDKCVYYGNMNIQNSHDCIGGVVGYTSDGGRISNCANLGTVTATKDGAYVGGVLGYVNNTKAMVKNCYNYGSVSNGSTSTYCGAVIGWVRSHTVGNLADNYYLDTSCSLGFGSASNSGATATAKTAEQFASGEVCYLLNGNTSDGAWGQTLSGTDKQDYPVLGGLPVYFRDEVYTNTYGILIVGTNTITTSNEPPTWYEFTPTETGSYQFSSTQLTAGNLYVNTTKTESDYTDITTSPTYDLEAATTYYVAVNYAPGSYDLTITRLNNTPTAIETVTTPQIYAVDGRIVCEGEFRIYDLLGRDVTRLNGSLSGVYVVKTADAAQKVVVK